jgi:hypothetical protein
VNQTVILWPVIALVVLVFAVYVVLGIRRAEAVRSGAAKLGQFKTRTTEPDVSATAANNVLNQFELPVLFYVGCLALLLIAGASYLTLTLAWLFVVTRYAHAWVHLTSNYVRYRSMLFFAGAVLVALLWLCLALRLAGVL